MDDYNDYYNEENNNEEEENKENEEDFQETEEKNESKEIDQNKEPSEIFNYIMSLLENYMEINIDNPKLLSEKLFEIYTCIITIFTNVIDLDSNSKQMYLAQIKSLEKKIFELNEHINLIKEEFRLYKGRVIEIPDDMNLSKKEMDLKAGIYILKRKLREVEEKTKINEMKFFCYIEELKAKIHDLEKNSKNTFFDMNLYNKTFNLSSDELNKVRLFPYLNQYKGEKPIFNPKKYIPLKKKEKIHQEMNRKFKNNNGFITNKKIYINNSLNQKLIEIETPKSLIDRQYYNNVVSKNKNLLVLKNKINDFNYIINTNKILGKSRDKISFNNINKSEI